MPLNLTSVLGKSAAKAAAVGVSFAVGGPLGALTGAFLAALLGEATAEFGREAIEKLVENAGESTLGKVLEQLADRFAARQPGIEAIQRKALDETRPRSGEFREWFDNWDACLDSREPLELEALRPGDAAKADYDALFRRALELLDAQGAAIRHTTLGLNRAPEEALVELVWKGLSARFEANFKELLTEPENGKAWIEAQQTFQWIVLRKLESIEEAGAETLLRVRTLSGFFTPEVIAGLAAAGRQVDAGQQKQIEELAAELKTTREAILGFLSILKEEPVALEQLPAKLAVIAQRHRGLLDRLSALEPEDAEARRYIEEARELIARARSAADYDRADELLGLAEGAQEQCGSADPTPAAKAKTPRGWGTRLIPAGCENTHQDG